MSRERPLGWVIPALCLALTLGMLWQDRAELAFYLSSAPTLDLGGPLGHDFARARPNRVGRIEGLPGPGAVRYRRALRERELIPILGTPVVVERSPVGRAPLSPGVPASPLTAEGRLLRDDQAPQYREVVTAFLLRDELAPPGKTLGTAHVWILLDGERPFRPSLGLLSGLALIGLACFNAAWLVKRLAKGG
ncbi:MAG: hypothetical protein ACYCWW_08120 [Deltaproteobacteria bacterium]